MDAVLAAPHCFEMIDPLTSSDAGENHALFVKPVRRNDDCDRLTSRLLRRVVEEALGAPVPTGYDAVEVLADNRVIAGLDDRADPTQALFTFVKRGFDLLAFSDVDAGRMQEHHRPLRVPNGMHGKIHDPLAPIAQPVWKLFAKNEAGGRLIRGEANFGFDMLRTPPPWRFPERPVQNLLSCVAAPFQRQVVGFSQIPLQV